MKLITTRSDLRAIRLIGLVTALGITPTVDAAPADLDTTFGIGGQVALPVQGSTSVVLQPDGKLLIADNPTQSATGFLSWRLRRYAVDGSPDGSFAAGAGVVAHFDLGYFQDDYLEAIALMNDGGIVAVGTADAHFSCPGGCGYAGIVARFNADGTLDTSFGSNGITGLSSTENSVAIEKDGKILIGGDFFSDPFEPVLTLSRLNADGSRDSSFTPALACHGHGAFHLDRDGKIVALTEPPVFAPDQGSCLTRLNADGSLDTAFGIQGKLTPACDGTGTFQIDPLGRIVVLMNPLMSASDQGSCLTRLNADGSLDTTFGMQGKLTISVGGANAALSSLFFDATGRIVLVGRLPIGPVLFRLTADGSLDSQFGLGGMIAGSLLPSAVASDCWNRTLVADVPSADGFQIARYLQDGSFDNAFGLLPRNDIPATPELRIRPNGRIIALASVGQAAGVVQLNIIQYQGDSPCDGTLAVEYYHSGWNYYFETAFPGEAAALDGGAFGGVWQRTGQTFNVWAEPNVLNSPTCRFFSTAFAPKSSHFYTPFPDECAAVKNEAAWQFEGIAFYVQIPTGFGTGNGSCPDGTVALYRVYNNGMGGAPNHRYTTSLGTLNTMIGQGWTFEGEANTKVFACVPP